jgi:sortase A
MLGIRRALAWLLVGAGVALVAYPALTYGTASLRQTRLAAEVQTLLGPSAVPSAPQIQRVRRLSAFRPQEGQPLGTIEIPSVGIDAVFLEGVTDQTLLAGPGHIPGTALPGTDDVSVLAAHRDMHFRALKDVTNGQRVRLRLPSGTKEYKVVGRRIVRPDDTTVTQLIGSPVLRLVTCWPPDFIGPAPERLVVSAIPVREPKPKKGTRVAKPDSGRIASTVTLAAARPEAVPPSRQAPIGTAGATLAGIAAYGAVRTRRRLGWWFLPWMGGLGLAALMLLASWAGPALARRSHVELAAHREVIHASAPRWGAPEAIGGGLYRMGRVTLAGPAMDAFLRAQRILGMEIQITDSFRSHAQQAAAYAAKPGWVAPPGHSLHEKGLAIDVHTGFLAAHPEVRDALYAAGWRQFDPYREPWHFSFGPRVG